VRTQAWSAKKTKIRNPDRFLSSLARLRTGYAGFDPLGFSDYYDIKWLQEAEIKHGRICMLAAVGMVCFSSCRGHCLNLLCALEGAFWCDRDPFQRSRVEWRHIACRLVL
jgi:hypothetical protein